MDPARRVAGLAGLRQWDPIIEQSAPPAGGCLDRTTSVIANVEAFTTLRHLVAALRPALATALIALAASGCAKDGQDASRMTVDTIGGVVHVRHAGNAAEWTLRGLASIGTAEGPVSFGRARSVIADREGNVYVADAQASEIAVFAPDGKHVRTIGRSGAGPGEFGDLYSLAWMGDTLAALDPGAARISLLSRSGDWIGQIPHEPITGPDIRLHSVGREVYSFAVRPGPENKLVRVYLRYTGSRIDTLPYPEQRLHGSPSTILCRHPARGGLTFFTNPFVPRVFQSPAPGNRVALVSSGAYRVDIVGSGGDTTMVIEKQHQPAPITDAEWEKATSPYREWAATAGGAKCEPVEFTRPSGKPALRTIFFDDAERMWVEVVTTEGHSFDVFDARGVHLGHLRSPVRQASVPPYVRGDRLYLVTTDSLDVQSVRVFGIER